MQIKSTYRLIASVLSISILAGVILPAGLHAKSAPEMCDEADMMHADREMPLTMMAGHEDSHMDLQHDAKNDPVPVVKMRMHDFGLICACGIEEAPVKTEAPVFNKTKTKILAVVQIIAEDHATQIEFDNHAILISDSYSPPPIFLVNETFIL